MKNALTIVQLKMIAAKPMICNYAERGGAGRASRSWMQPARATTGAQVPDPTSIAQEEMLEDCDTRPTT